MKIFATLVLFLALSPAHADSSNGTVYPVYDQQAPEIDSEAGNQNSFNYDPQTGHAWIEIYVESDVNPDDDGDISARVNGLTYSAQDQMIYFDANGWQVACAWIAPSRWYQWGTQVIDTGNCEITARAEVRTSDDGFHDVTTRYIHADIVVNENIQHYACDDWRVFWHLPCLPGTD